MKAASIAVRISDFLKEYPPFRFLEREDVVALASRGRVRFHEDGEIVFAHGSPRDQWIYVIQQGKVRIVEESLEGENLIDYRGPGDILGLQGLYSEEPYGSTGKTDTETILYALPREDLAALIGRSPKARRYLASYFTLNPAQANESEVNQAEWLGAENRLSPITLRKGGLFEVGPPQEVARETLTVTSPDCPLREIARKLQSKRIHCVLIVDSEGRPLGKITDADLRDRVEAGMIHPDSTARDIMMTDIVTAHPEEDTGVLLIKLTRSSKHFLIVTENGQLDGKAVGIVSERNLFLHYGRFPTVLGEAFESAPDLETLRRLRNRVESLILEFIESRVSLPWLMEMTGILNRKMARRILTLAESALAAEGVVKPNLDFTWLMMGSGGRDELLIRSALYHALVYEDPESSEADGAADYFCQLATRASSYFKICGFMESLQGVLAQNPGWCLPLSAMKKRYVDFITHPKEQHVYSARDAFDFKAAREQCPIAASLRETIVEELKTADVFLRQMALDSLLNQPPKTIFQGYVVDNLGVERDELAIKFHALLPLVDIARVLSLENGEMTETATWKRLEIAAKRLEGENPEGAALLREASGAFLVAQYARIKRGLLAGTDGAVIRPANLEEETRALLVTSFRSILAALEFLADRYGFSIRAG